MAADRNPTKFPDEETTDRWYATHHACLCPFWNYQVLSRYIADTYFVKRMLASFPTFTEPRHLGLGMTRCRARR